MRNLFAALALVGLLAGLGLADDPKETPTKKVLKAGDPAPALKATKWLQGKEIETFEPGRVYVVEFWATWCGPCIVMMPHLSELQAEYKDKGVTIIGHSSKDPRNSEAQVTAFVKKRGPKLGYTFAYADNRDTNNAWMVAAGKNGIPCSFVVDKEGKIAYIGHPMYLDVVLPRVVEGKWNDKSKREVDRIEKEVNGLFTALRKTDREATLNLFKDFETRNPALSHIPYFIGPKMDMMLKTKKMNDARKMAEDVLARAIKQDDPTALRTVSSIMRSDAAKGNKDLLALSLRAAQAMVKVAGEDDAMALFNLAEAYFATGDRAKAREYGKKAVEAADTPARKRSLEQQIKKFEDEKD